MVGRGEKFFIKWFEAEVTTKDIIFDEEGNFGIRRLINYHHNAARYKFFIQLKDYTIGNNAAKKLIKSWVNAN